MDSWSVSKNKFVQGEHKLWNMSSQMVYLIKKYTCISYKYLTFMLFFLICIVIRCLISPFQVFIQTFSLTFSWHVICHDAVCAASTPMCIGQIFFFLIRLTRNFYISRPKRILSNFFFSWHKHDTIIEYSKNYFSPYTQYTIHLLKFSSYNKDTPPLGHQNVLMICPYLICFYILYFPD